MASLVNRGLRSTFSISRALLTCEPLLARSTLTATYPLPTIPSTPWAAHNTPLPLVGQARGLRIPSKGPRVTRGTVGERSVATQQEVMQDTAENNQQLTEEVLERVNGQVSSGSTGRLFAVVFLQGKQHLITPEDLIVIQGVYPPNIGDKLKLAKVMCVGGQDFTIYGRPLLRPGLVHVEATVVEKTLSHCRVYFYKRPKKNSQKTKFSRETLTLLRINKIEVTRPIEEVPEVEGVEGKIF